MGSGVGLGISTILLVPVVSTCTFEPRDRADSPAIEESRETSTVAPPLELTEDAALQTIQHFRSSIAVGDLSRALALLDGDATLVDALAGEASEAATRGELLLELRRRHAEGISLDPVSTRVALLTGDAALLVSRLEVLETDADGVVSSVGYLHETVLLVGSSGGWRIRDLHRSFLPGDPLPDSLRT